jgi:hypothetical protein
LQNTHKTRCEAEGDRESERLEPTTTTAHEQNSIISFDVFVIVVVISFSGLPVATATGNQLDYCDKLLSHN